MQTHARADSDSTSDSSDDGTYKLRKDEYGDKFEDWGFLKRAEDFKAAGNADFKKDRFEKALAEYAKALDQLITVEHDKSITIGQRKWADVVVMRSTIHLNISTCHYKMELWREALKEAEECLHGSIREQQMFSDPHIRKKVRDAERKSGALSMQIGEHRLPRAIRAKAWFRVSQCNAQLDYLDRAKDAMAKALENCDDDRLLAELSQHALRLDALEQDQRGKQKKQFAGFWDRLQDRGGYNEDGKDKPVADAAGTDAGAPSKGRAEEAKSKISADQRARFESLDDSD